MASSLARLVRPAAPHASSAMRGMSTLGTVLSDAAEALPNKDILRDLEQGYKWSVCDLDRHSAALATGLAEMGLAKGDVLTSWLPNNAENCVVQLAAAKGGFVLHSVAPDAAKATVVAATAGAKAIIFDPALEAEAAVEANMDHLGTRTYVSDPSWAAHISVPRLPCHTRGDAQHGAATRALGKDCAVITSGWERIEGMENLREVLCYGGKDAAFAVDASAVSGSDTAVVSFGADGEKSAPLTHKQVLAGGATMAESAGIGSLDTGVLAAPSVAGVAAALTTLARVVIPSAEGAAAAVEAEGATVMIDGAGAQRL